MLWQKLLIISLIGLGESTLILAQINGAKLSETNNWWQALSLTNWYLWASILGSILIIIGYFYGITVLKNIWLVTIVSWGTIVIVEPIISYLVFKIVPQGNILIGFVLVTLGFVIANINK